MRSNTRLLADSSKSHQKKSMIRCLLKFLIRATEFRRKKFQKFGANLCAGKIKILKPKAQVLAFISSNILSNFTAALSALNLNSKREPKFHSLCRLKLWKANLKPTKQKVKAMQQQLSVLIVDDEVELRKSVVHILQSTLSDVTFAITEAGNGREALDLFQRQSFDLVMMDVRMPEMSGLEALSKMKEHDPRTFILIMTAHSNLQDAVTAIKDGAYDYVEKPVNPQRLSEIVRKSLEARDMVSSLALSNPIFDDDVDSEFVGSSKKMREVFDLIYKLCKVDTTVLVRGENGTGKELVAKAIHFNSPRKGGPFVAINCGAIPENLMESELFGHEKG